MLLTLAQAEIFKSIPQRDLSEVARRSHTRSFLAGEELMRQGDDSNAMYVIVKGRVRVDRRVPWAEGALQLADLGAGEVVGEMGVLDSKPRSATVTAIEDTVTVEVTAAALTDLLSKYPDFSRALLRLLSTRLRNTDELLERAIGVGRS